MYENQSVISVNSNRRFSNMHDSSMSSIGSQNRRMSKMNENVQNRRMSKMEETIMNSVNNRRMSQMNDLREKS